MEKIQLKTAKRDSKAATPASIRKAGLVPAILYGHKVANIELAVNAQEFEKVFRKAGESTILELVTDDGKAHAVIVQEVQRHHLTSRPIHVDFYQVDMTAKLKATVPLEFIGEANAVKALGGTLVKIITEVEVECLPSDLPHNLVVDISSLQTFEDTIHVKDVKVSDKVEVLTPAEDTIVKVQPPRDVEAELAAPVVEDISAVEGAAEDKPAAEGEEAAESKEEKPAKKE